MLNPRRPLGREYGDRYGHWRTIRLRCRFHVRYDDLSVYQGFLPSAYLYTAHNEYEIGNWRAPRHRLSNESYILNYKRNVPVSEPEEEWDARNLLYPLRYDLATYLQYPASNLRQRYEIKQPKSRSVSSPRNVSFSVFDGMTELCKTYFPCEPKRAQEELQDSRFHQPSMYRDGPYDVGEDEQEQEEEREEEEKDAGAK